MVHLSSKFVMQYRCSTFGPPCLPISTLHHKQKNQCENNPGIKIDKPGENQKNIEKTKKTKKNKKTKKINNFRLFRKWGPSPRPSENCFFFCFFWYFCFFCFFWFSRGFFGFLQFLQVFCWGGCEASLAWEGPFAKHVVFVMTRVTESMVTKTMNQG